MGYYIDYDSKGDHIGVSYHQKINSLKNDGAEIVQPTEFEKDLVVVVDNGHFAAAGYAYSEEEFKEFRSETRRPTTWLRYKHAAKLSGYEK